MLEPNGEEIYQIIEKNIHLMSFVRAYTPLFNNHERINILWLWCMENYDKYDSTKGTLETWIKGVFRRIICAYRKERGSRHNICTQFPIVYSRFTGEEIHYENLLPEKNKHGTYNARYSLHERVHDDKEQFDLINKKIDKVLDKDINRVILRNAGRMYSDKAISNEMGLKKNTLQIRRKQYKDKLLESINHEYTKVS